MLLLLVFGFVAAASLLGGFWLIGGDYPLLLVKHGGYWLILFTFFVFLYSVFQNRRIHFKNPKDLIRANKWAFVFAAVVIGVCFLLQDAFFKITMDEVVLASTSMHMHLEKEVFTASRGYEVNGVFYILGGYLDKRPYFFAFVVSLVHDLIGYRPGNVFIVNAVVGFFLLIGVYLAGTQFGGKRWGWLALLLLISLPLFGFNVTGGGFELFNLLMLLVTVYFGKCWLENRTRINFTTFVYSGLLLAQCRYESILFVFPVGFLILYGWWREKKVLLPWPLFFAPFILVPYVLQNRVLNETKVLWQLEKHQAAPFGLHYLSQNLRAAVDFFFHYGTDQANSLVLISLAGLAALLFVLYRMRFAAYFPQSHTSWRLVSRAFGVTILFNFVLLMFYYWGQLNDPVASRLGLPAHLALIFLIVYVFSRQPWAAILFPMSTAAVLACTWFFAIPNLAQASFMRLAYEARQIDWMNEKLEAHRGNILVITDYHIMGLVDGFSAVPIGHIIERKPELEFHVRNETFSDILLVHRESESETKVLGNQKLYGLEELETHFELEPVYSYSLDSRDTAMISRVKSIRLSRGEQITYQEHLDEIAEARAASEVDLTTFFSKWLP